MKQEEIQKRNNQIALMLGYVNTTPKDKDFNIFEVKEESLAIPKMIETMSMKFHLDWNWLMKAVDFIEKQIIAVWIHGNNCLIQSVGKKENKFLPITYADVYSENKIQTVFIAVSDFAKLYNENKI